MPPAEQQQTAKQTTPNAQTKMAIRPHRATRDRKANNIQCADQNGDTPLPSNNSLQEQQPPMRRVEWRSAPAEQQKTAKQTASNAQTKMAFCHYRVTIDYRPKCCSAPLRTTRDFIPKPAVFPLNFFLKSRILYL